MADSQPAPGWSNIAGWYDELTLYHPFYTPTLPRNFRHLKPIAMRRALLKMRADLLRHKRQDRVGDLILRGLDRLTTARGQLARITTFPAQP